MSHTRTVISDPVAEGTTPLLSATFTSDGVTPVVSLETAVLRLYDMRTNSVINGHEATDLMPFITSGQLAFWLSSGDTIIVNDNSSREAHVARINYTWNLGTRRGIHEIEHLVVNLV